MGSTQGRKHPMRGTARKTKRVPTLLALRLPQLLRPVLARGSSGGVRIIVVTIVYSPVQQPPLTSPQPMKSLAPPGRGSPCR